MARQKRQKYDWTVKFEHGDKRVWAGGTKLGASGESSVRGHARKGEDWRAEISVLANTVKDVKVDGELVFSRAQGQTGEDIPSWPDENNVTTDERLLQYIITVEAPHLADKYGELFDPYYLEDTDDHFWERMENGAGSPSGNPTPLSSARTKSREDAEAT